MNIIGLTGDENMNQKDIIINEYNTGNYQDKIADFNQKYAECYGNIRLKISGKTDFSAIFPVNKNL